MGRVRNKERKFTTYGLPVPPRRESHTNQRTCVAKLSSSSNTHLPAFSALRNTPSHHENRALVPPLPSVCWLESVSGTGRSEPNRSDTSVCSERFMRTSCRGGNGGGNQQIDQGPRNFENEMRLAHQDKPNVKPRKT